ncbi:hypothetical protein J7E50_10645 [Pedobacter sp. ISL-68]|uniref:hypothetical protein n=1 Tax=unclassified Pedobacter TaxID=2628915 RepID=UPI001BE7F011|nr:MULTISPECIES: hypothetical protein [unclassified Pedobacter]MBT2561288.1 hypothetical protein [Pedobacter sp. ISL-64]MBT2590678.1 hypothetical protein [Pedobacter sp. ISL-68]
MKEENLKALEQQFFYSDMKDISREELIRNMNEGKDAFSLQLTKTIGTATATANINCGLSKQKNYFANHYDLTVKHEGKPEYSRNYKFKRADPVITKNEAGEENKQWINSTLTFKEAFNQMEGRAINKDYVYVDEKEPRNNRKYNAWEYIDFTKPDANGICPAVKEYNFDLEKKFEGIPLPVLDNEDTAKQFFDSMKRGNIQIADYTKPDGTTDKMYFEANPKHNMVNQYDKDMKPVLLSLKRQQGTAEGLKQENDQKQSDPVTVGKKKGKKGGDVAEEDTKQNHSRGLRA